MNDTTDYFSFVDRHLELLGLNPKMDQVWFEVIDIAISFALAIGLFFLMRVFLVKYMTKLTKKTKTKWDDIIAEKGVFKRITLLFPAIILHIFLPIAINNHPLHLIFFQKAINIYITIVIALIINSGLNAANAIYSYYQVSKTRPIKSLVQALIIINYFIAFLFSISIIRDIEIGKIFIGLGTISAVLLLVFKDSILGFVSGVQISMNNLVQIGDWITMKKHNADGTVIDISLTTVKVQNFDKTIITIPTYSMLVDSFQNWRGMEESGGRRIKRSLSIDLNSIRFCTSEEMNSFHEIALLKPYLKRKEEEINFHNEKLELTEKHTLNRRSQTNIGVFRAYAEAYLKEHPSIYNSGFTFMVRQLPSNDKGLPVEVYVSTKTTDWVTYEGIMSDIFDHLFASLMYFDLKPVQIPIGQEFTVKSCTEENIS